MEPDFNPLEIALDEARSTQADEAEAYFEREVGLSVKVFNKRVERFAFSESSGLGLRINNGSRPGRAYTSDISRQAIGQAARSALAGAMSSPKDPYRKLPAKDQFPTGAATGKCLGEDLDIWEEGLEETTPREKIEFTLGLEQQAREYDPRIVGVETAAYGESISHVLLASTNGFKAGYRQSICYGYLMAIAEENGESQTGFGFTAGRSFDSLDLSAASIEAASMAVDLLGGRQVETSRVPVLLNNLATAEVIAVFGAALSGESALKGRSFLAGKIGQKIAHESVRIVDDALMQGGFGTAPFDVEGIAGSCKSPVEEGILTTFLHNSYTASRMAVENTGNGGRSSYRSQVGVMPTNLILEPGKDTPDELRSGMGTGFEVLELQGTHVGLNPVTGEVSVGAKGRWIEHGRPAFAVREVTIAGTLDELFKGIIAIGNDLRFTPLLGGIGTPSILIEGLVVSGK